MHKLKALQTPAPAGTQRPPPAHPFSKPYAVVQEPLRPEGRQHPAPPASRLAGKPRQRLGRNLYLAPSEPWSRPRRRRPVPLAGAAVSTPVRAAAQGLFFKARSAFPLRAGRAVHKDGTVFDTTPPPDPTPGAASQQRHRSVPRRSGYVGGYTDWVNGFFLHKAEIPLRPGPTPAIPPADVPAGRPRHSPPQDRWAHLPA